jgi:hypothetical protein
MLSYRAILKQAWKISWKNKFLWFFGFFATLVSFTVETKIMSRSFNQEAGISSLSDLILFLNTGIFSANSWANAFNLLKSNPGTMMLLILFLLIILAITLFFLWLAVSSQIGIINAVAKLTKKQNEKLSIKGLLKGGQKRFWPVLWLNLAISIVINILFLLISLLFIIVIIKSQVFTSILYGIIFIAFIPVALFLSFIAKYAIAAVILEGKKFAPAIKDGWQLFFNNWLISVEMAIILFFINVIAIVLLSLLSFIGFTLFFGIALSVNMLASSIFLFWLFVAIGFLLVMFIMVLGSSFVNVFQTASWTNLFVQLKGEGGSSKLERVFTEK